MIRGIDIIIVSYYSKIKLIQLLNSINTSVAVNFTIQIIIINNSVDEILDNLECVFELKIINNKQNVGFGAACNQALQFVTHNYQLLLNPDTIVFPETFNKSFLYLESEPTITVLGIRHLDAHLKTTFSCSRLPNLSSYIFDLFGLSKLYPKVFKPAYLMTDWNHENSAYVDQVMGAYLMIRNSFIKFHGFMDPRFFVFLEDADLCKKVLLNNGTVYYNSDISLIHEGGNSTDGISDKKLCYLLEGKLKYAYKYFDYWQYIILLFAVLVIEPFARLFYCLIKDKADIRHTLKGYSLFISRHQFK